MACQVLELPSLGFEDLVKAESHSQLRLLKFQAVLMALTLFPPRLEKKKSGNTLINIVPVAVLGSGTW